MSLFNPEIKKAKERQLFGPERRKRRRDQSQLGNGRRDTEAENRIFRNRVIACLAVCAVMVAVLFSNLYYLQVISYKDYQTRSNENRLKIVPVVPSRGIIYDRNGVVLADNRPVYHLVLYPAKEFDTLAEIRELNALLSLDLTEREAVSLSRQATTRKKFSGIEISDLLSEEQIATFSVNSYRYPNVQVAASLKRYYPFADIATHAIGYVSRINQADVDMLTADGRIDNYEGSTEIGKLGIEKYYEDVLHGRTGSREVEVNSHGQIIRTIKYNPPKPGDDITVSLDIRLQYYAQELLGDTRGAIAALDPASGEILAMYSNPSYDPNLFVRGIRSRDYSRLLNNPGRPLINRVTQGGYAPASTAKPLMCVMGLNEGLVTPTGSFYGMPYFRLPNSTHQFRDWRSWGHGWLDLYRALEVSADTYFYDLAYRAGINTIHRYLDLFGFGRRTNIDLMEESTGVNPSREWKRARFHKGWALGDTVPIGIGQGYWTTTLMQLVKAHMTLSERGKVNTPHLMRAISDPADGGKLKRGFENREKPPYIELRDSSYWDVCRDGMYLVVNGPEGTGRRAFEGARYKAAGKSGTAQLVAVKQGEKYDASKLKVEHRDNALFVAYAPFLKPRILVGVILENAGGGSRMAAPIARALIDKYLLELNPGGYMGESEPRYVKFGMGGTVGVQ